MKRVSEMPPLRNQRQCSTRILQKGLHNKKTQEMLRDANVEKYNWSKDDFTNEYANKMHGGGKYSTAWLRKHTVSIIKSKGRRL